MISQQTRSNPVVHEIRMEASVSDDVIVGSCSSMCPPAERDERRKQKRLHVFEIPSDTYLNYPVKEFCRSAAGKKICPSELRPTDVLLTTMEYLFNNIVDREDHPWTVVYHFVFDRIRAIRQDMVIQRIENEAAVEILEKAVRFHILAGFHLYELSIEQFDPCINDKHIQECLKRLLLLYDNYPHSPNRAEFESYYLLHNLGSHDAMEHSLRLPEYIKCHQIFRTSWDISLMKLLGNFVGLFRLVRQLPFLASCLVQKHSTSICHNAVAVLNAAFSNPNCQFPITVLLSTLMFNDEQEAQSFLACFGIETKNGFIKFSKKSFSVPEKLPKRLKCQPIAGKMTGLKKKILQDSCSLQISGSMKEGQKSERMEAKIERVVSQSSVEKTNMFALSQVNKPLIRRGRGRSSGHSHLENQKSKSLGRGRGKPVP